MQRGTNPGPHEIGDENDASVGAKWCHVGGIRVFDHGNAAGGGVC